MCLIFLHVVNILILILLEYKQFIMLAGMLKKLQAGLCPLSPQNEETCSSVVCISTFTTVAGNNVPQRSKMIPISKLLLCSFRFFTCDFFFISHMFSHLHSSLHLKEQLVATTSFSYFTRKK